MRSGVCICAFNCDAHIVCSCVFIRFPHILPLISATTEFMKLTGPVIMPTPVAHTSSLIKFVVVRNDQ